MTTITEKLVRQLADKQILQLIRNYEQFERDGFIGESELRALAEKLMNQFGSAGHTVLWMERLAFEAYRYFAEKYIDIYERRMKLTSGESYPCHEVAITKSVTCTLTPPEEETP